MQCHCERYSYKSEKVSMTTGQTEWRGGEGRRDMYWVFPQFPLSSFYVFIFFWISDVQMNIYFSHVSMFLARSINRGSHKGRGCRRSQACSVSNGVDKRLLLARVCLGNKSTLLTKRRGKLPILVFHGLPLSCYLFICFDSRFLPID